MLVNNNNLLPCNGIVNYTPALLTPLQANEYYTTLLQTIPWQHDEVVIFGKKITTKRKTAWYGTNAFTYTYSNTKKTALPFTPELLELKNITEAACGHTFNSCLLNLYHNGTEGMGWHSDNEKEMGSVIASVSLGEERKFVFKHRSTREKVEVNLQNGSVLLMKGDTQKYWIHTLPIMLKKNNARINLTFRNLLYLP